MQTPATPPDVIQLQDALEAMQKERDGAIAHAETLQTDIEEKAQVLISKDAKINELENNLDNALIGRQQLEDELARAGATAEGIELPLAAAGLVWCEMLRLVGFPASNRFPRSFHHENGTVFAVEQRDGGVRLEARESAYAIDAARNRITTLTYDLAKPAGELKEFAKQLEGYERIPEDARTNQAKLAIPELKQRMVEAQKAFDAIQDEMIELKGKVDAAAVREYFFSGEMVVRMVATGLPMAEVEGDDEEEEA